MVKTDIEVTEVVDEDAANMAWSCDGLWWVVHMNIDNLPVIAEAPILTA